MTPEGERQSVILRAQGARQGQLLRAQGYAAALKSIYRAEQTIDQKTMTLQYFEALKKIGAGESTKYIFPLEFTSLLQNFMKGKEET